MSVPLRDAICLRVDRYNDPSLGRVLIEIALCNDRETPTPIPTAMWMFQTKLHVTDGGRLSCCRFTTRWNRTGLSLIQRCSD